MTHAEGTLSVAGHKTRVLRTFDAQLAALAGERHLVFGLAELTELGLSASAVRGRVAAGRLHRVHQGVYALVAPALLTVAGRYRAAVLASTGAVHAAALGARSAADLQALRACHRRTVEVIVPGRSTHRHPGIQVHRSVNLAARDVTTVDGIPVTTVARTLLDLAALVPRRALERALDRAEQLRVFDLRELLDQLARNPAHPGAGRLRATLARHEAGATITDSAFEEAFLEFCPVHDLPPPRCNAAVDPGDGGLLIRPDFSWPTRRVAVEVDGERFHLTHRAFEDDRVRDQRLTAAGWRVVRVTWRQLTERPDELGARLRRLLV